MCVFISFKMYQSKISSLDNITARIYTLYGFDAVIEIQSGGSLGLMVYTKSGSIVICKY